MNFLLFNCLSVYLPIYSSIAQSSLLSHTLNEFSGSLTSCPLAISPPPPTPHPQAYGWALEGMRHLAATTMEECTKAEKCQAAIGRLEAYSREHPPIADALFQEMKATAGELRGDRGLRQWGFAWAKCQETSRVFDKKMEAALRTRDSAHRRRSDSAVSRSSASIKKTLSGLWGGSGSDSRLLEDEEGSTPSSSTSSSSSSLLFSASSSPATPQHTPLLRRLLRSASVEETAVAATNTTSDRPSASSRRQQMRKIQSFDVPSTPETRRCGPRTLTEPPRRGNTGVFIRGLEVSSTESTERPPWSGPVPCKTSTPEQQPRGRWVWSPMAHGLISMKLTSNS